ncbi:MAG: hypothetical protein FMNOHCHN_00528 [Ignavibacteriaceae bacterium]|nr:hypothetical protein [Ignavibacteriaceae bacterium]
MIDLHNYSEDNLLAQIENSTYELGFYRVKFYTKNGLPSDQPTDTIEEFYLYPSGGTLRDKKFNIIFYSSKFDTYRGFVPPHLKS